MSDIISDSNGWVAGHSAAGHGILTGWRGWRDMTHDRLVDISTLAEIPRDWLPKVKDAAVQLGRAMQAVAGNRYWAERVRRVSDDEGNLPTWDCSWRLVRRGSSDDGAQAGDATAVVSLVVKLYDTEDGAPLLTFERDESDFRTEPLQQEVREAFDRRIGEQRYTASDITKWLGDTLRRRLGAVRYGGNWYVPYKVVDPFGDNPWNYRDRAERLIEVMRESGWGSHYMYPALPIATSPQLSLGLSLGLQDEVAEVMTTLEAARKQARENGRPDIGENAVTSYRAKLEEINARVYEKRDLLGPERTTETLNVLADAHILLDSILEAAAAREAA